MKVSLIICMILFALLRMAGVFGDLWLDEVWSLTLMREVASLGQIVGVYHDNNHLLNSVWLWLLSGAQPPWVYRALSLLCALLSFPLFVMVVRLIDGKLLAVASILAGCNYLLVLYGSEARGYSSMLLGALLVLYGALRNSKEDLFISSVTIALGTLLAAVSHGSFIFLWIPSLLISLLALRVQSGSVRQVLIRWGPAALIVVGLWQLFYRHLPPGSGPLVSHFQIVIDFFSTLVGGYSLSAAAPEISVWFFLLALLVMVAILVETVMLVRERHLLGILSLSTIGTVLLLGLLIIQPRVLFVRYFVIVLPLILVVLASFLVRLRAASRTASIIATGLMLGYVGGNLLQVFELVKYGRSQERKALLRLVAAFPEGRVSFSTNHEFRMGMMLEHLRRREPALGRLKLVSSTVVDEGCPTAHLATTSDPFEHLPEGHPSSCGANLRRAETFPSAHLAGEQVTTYIATPAGS